MCEVAHQSFLINDKMDLSLFFDAARTPNTHSPSNHNHNNSRSDNREWNRLPSVFGTRSRNNVSRDNNCNQDLHKGVCVCAQCACVWAHARSFIIKLKNGTRH